MKFFIPVSNHRRERRLLVFIYSDVILDNKTLLGSKSTNEAAPLKGLRDVGIDGRAACGFQAFQLAGGGDKKDLRGEGTKEEAAEEGSPS